MQHDISVPVERMPEFVTAAIPAIECEFPGVRGVAFGHLGDGNVHFHVLAPQGAVRGTWEEIEGKAISHRVRSEEHTSELQSLMRISYAVFCLKKTTTY